MPTFVFYEYISDSYGRNICGYKEKVIIATERRDVGNLN